MTRVNTASRTTRWALAKADPDLVAALARELGLTAVTARALVSRGVDSPPAARSFLEPDLVRDWPDAGAIPGLDGAASRVATAVRAGERIVVFGDFDLDGISAAAVVACGLRAAGAHVQAVVPHRFREGYGLSGAAVERVAGLAPDLVITVDCGIANAVETEALRARGIDVVVTDHHEPGDAVPDGIPVANPRLAPDGPMLAGAGVALALVREVGGLLGMPSLWRDLTDLAMLGTVADIVPLTGANRALVADGLARARSRPRAGLAALASVAGVPIEGLSADQVAYALAPRLNAAGRMADPAISLELLLTEDGGVAERLSGALDEHNRARQTVEAELSEAALAQAAERFREDDRVLLVAGENWHEGVRGIVASRLVARFGVPALVFCIEDGQAQGSGRSVGGVDLHAALERTSGMLTRFGGHAMAVGATLPAGRLDELRAALAADLAHLDADAFIPEVTIDAEVPLGELSRELAAELERLAPFGHANPRPLLAARGVFMTGRSRVGATGDHLRFTAFDGVASVGAICFRCPDIEMMAEHDVASDLAFELDVNAWRGAERIQMLVRDIRTLLPEDGPVAALVEDLFAHAEEIVARGEYQGIEDAERFHTKLAGVTFEGRQEVVARLLPGVPLRLEREPDNVHDPAACAVFDPFGDRVGYLNRRLAGALAPVLDAGVEYDITVADVTGGAEGESLGVNVLLERRWGGETAEDAAEARAARRTELAGLGPDALAEAIRGALIGDAVPHAAQREALAHLAEGRSTLVVMATGRGKSFIFQTHAAREALATGRASVFVYPLRALVADQSFHLERLFGGLGLTVRTLTGESAPSDRDTIFAGLAEGVVDVVLTTPEFLDHHAERFAVSGRIGFLVIDEAHHVGLARAGHRPAYARLGDAAARLGSPVVLAVTATAPDDAAETIAATFGIGAVVLDPSTRDNLGIVDRRGSSDKAAALASLVASGEKTIVYVNSRETSVVVAREIRRRVPALLHRVAFYNGGMNRSARHAVERAFRDGEIDVVVATSAFGEGVNIPDVRHAVVYHLPMGEVAFNQQCGRCGRDGRPSSVHLLFGAGDVRLNRRILSSSAPSREDLAALYVTLRDAARDGDGTIEITNADLAERVSARRPASGLSERGVSTAIGVFRELGLVSSEGIGAYRRLTMLPAPAAKLDLTASVRYAEGLDEIVSFEEFALRALEAPANELLQAFNRPILPTRPPAGAS